MLINSTTALHCKNVLLVPYCKHHVPRYHKWMSSAELRQLTASEELTLEEELENQQSWREDCAKLTFISCDASAWLARTRGAESAAEEERYVVAGLDDADEVMRGDVNMFFQDTDDEDDGVVGELNIMVAVPTARGQGFGKRVLMMFLSYVIGNQGEIMREYCNGGSGEKTLGEFVVKIDQGNGVSIQMFESVGFARIAAEASYFGEVELRIGIEGAKRQVKDYFGGVMVDMLSFPNGTAQDTARAFA